MLVGLPRDCGAHPLPCVFEELGEELGIYFWSEVERNHELAVALAAVDPVDALLAVFRFSRPNKAHGCNDVIERFAVMVFHQAGLGQRDPMSGLKPGWMPWGRASAMVGSRKSFSTSIRSRGSAPKSARRS